MKFANGEVFIPRGVALEVYTEDGPDRGLRLYASFFRCPRSMATHPMEGARFMMPVGGVYSCVEAIKPLLLEVIKPWSEVSENDCWCAAYVPVYGVDGQIVQELSTRDIADELEGVTQEPPREAVVLQFHPRNANVCPTNTT